MTKSTSRQRKCAMLFNQKKYNENFPSDIDHDRLRDRFITDVVEKPVFTWPDKDVGNRNESPTFPFAVPVRRHSWSSGVNPLKQPDKLDRSDSSKVPSRKASQESRKSSTASIPEKIEECTSDDELELLAEENEENEKNLKSNAVRCRNCFQIDASLTADSVNNYCKQCQELLTQRTSAVLHKLNSNDIKKLQTTECSSRKVRKSSLPEWHDLPRIMEPLFDEETNDTKEMKLLVEKEVHKLLNFNKATFHHQLQLRRNSENDRELIKSTRPTTQTITSKLL